MSGSSINSVLEVLSLLVDDRAGVVARVDPLPLPPEYQDLIHGFQASVGDARRLHPGMIKADNTESFAGYGTAFEEPLARVRAVCEALERYSGLMHPLEGLVVATQRELGDGALDPRRLPQCSLDERARARPELRLQEADPDLPIQWVRGWSLTRRRPLFVPLTATYLGLPVPIREHVTYPMSTGFAAGTSYERALLSALSEVIERDSLALWWLQQLPFPRLDVELARSPVLETLVRRRAKHGVETALFDLTTDVGVPVIGLVQTSAIHRPHVVTMAACRPRAAAAMERVVEEAESLRIALGRYGEAHVAGAGAHAAGDPSSAVAFGMQYAGPEAVERFRFALTAEKQPAMPADLDEQNALALIINNLSAIGMEVIAVDVTCPEVRDFGVVVVRVIVPELMTITFSHAVRYLGHPRLYEAPEKLGFGRRDESMITKDPIPYA